MERYYEVRIGEGKDAKQAYLKVDGDSLVSMFRLGNAKIRELSPEEMDRVLIPRDTQIPTPMPTTTPLEEMEVHRASGGIRFPQPLETIPLPSNPAQYADYFQL